MKPFEYTAPETLEEALALLNQDDGARPFAGGTDLLAEMKRGLCAPTRLVNLKSVRGLNHIRKDPDGGLVIGALAKLSDIEAHPLIAQHAALLAQAIRKTASPQIRNTATLGGNLCQRPRCYYYRHPDFPCIRKSGEGCFAAAGQSRYHGIFGGRRCFMVHPSDPAPALVAADARVRIAGPSGSRTLRLEDFFIGPRESLSRETALAPGEILTEIRIPPQPPGVCSLYLKAAERRAVDFALASVALSLAFTESRVSHARLVLGGVAPVPWRAPSADAALLNSDLSDAAIRETCDIAVAGARPLPQNAYKVPLVKGLIRKALHRLRDRHGR